MRPISLHREPGSRFSGRRHQENGYHVVIIHAASEQEQQRVQDVINTDQRSQLIDMRQSPDLLMCITRSQPG